MDSTGTFHVFREDIRETKFETEKPHTYLRSTEKLSSILGLFLGFQSFSGGQTDST